MGVWCKRWWLAVAACALIARGEAAEGPPPSVMRMQCDVHPHMICESTKNPEMFLINGQEHRISYLNGVTFEGSCTAASLDENIWPFFPQPVKFSEAILRNCPPPEVYTNYISALRSLNVTVTGTLRLLDLPSNEIITGTHLEQLPPSLELASVEGSTLTLQPSALLKLDSLQSLSLYHIIFDQLPANLVHLTLNDTGTTNLDPGSFINLSGNVQIYVDGLYSFSINVPKVRSLNISSPELFTLSIADAPVEALGSGFLSGTYELDTLELKGLREHSGDEKKRQLPTELLTRLWSMFKFSLTESDIVTLPHDLFLYTPNIREIDLSNNLIKSIPKELFSGLNDLETLSLADNNIVFSDLQVIADLPNLDRLTLRGNRIESVCPEGGESKLAKLNLNYLDISQSNLSHICVDWFKNMRDLYLLNLTNNAITSLNCTQLDASRNYHRIGRASMALHKNPISVFHCTKEDYDKAVHASFNQGAELLIPHATCDCGGYWLKRTLKARDVMLTEMNPITCDGQQPQCS